MPLLLLAGCTPVPCEAKYGYGHFAGGITVQADSVSPGGIRYDSSGQAFYGPLLDRLTDEVAECMLMSIDRSSFKVKVPADWAFSCDGTQQVLPIIASQGGCLAKGQTPTPDCPCRFRAVVQCPNVIVSTPSLYLYKDALVRWLTGSRNPWADKNLVKCVEPTTAPLSMGAP